MARVAHAAQPEADGAGGRGGAKGKGKGGEAYETRTAWVADGSRPPYRLHASTPAARTLVAGLAPGQRVVVARCKRDAASQGARFYVNDESAARAATRDDDVVWLAAGPGVPQGATEVVEAEERWHALRTLRNPKPAARVGDLVTLVGRVEYTEVKPSDGGGDFLRVDLVCWDGEHITLRCWGWAENPLQVGTVYACMGLKVCNGQRWDAVAYSKMKKSPGESDAQFDKRAKRTCYKEVSLRTLRVVNATAATAFAAVAVDVSGGMVDGLSEASSAGQPEGRGTKRRLRNASPDVRQGSANVSAIVSDSD